MREMQQFEKRHKGRQQLEYFNGITNLSYTDRYILDRIYALEDKIDRLLDATEKPKGDL